MDLYHSKIHNFWSFSFD